MTQFDPKKIKTPRLISLALYLSDLGRDGLLPKKGDDPFSLPTQIAEDIQRLHDEMEVKHD